MIIELTDLQAFAAESVSDVGEAFLLGIIAGALLVCAGVMIERNRK